MSPRVKHACNRWQKRGPSARTASHVRVPVTAAAFLVLLTCSAGWAQDTAIKPAPWLLAFDGKSTNALVMDKRFPPFLRTHVTNAPIRYWLSDKATAPAKDALDFLHGPPDVVRVAEKRYVVASACVPHDCMDRGLLWVDTLTGATVFAASVYTSPVPMTNNRAHLWLFTNALIQANTLPPTLLEHLSPWSAEPNGDGSKTAIAEVTLVEPNGTQLKLTSADVHAWNVENRAGK